MKTYRFTMSYGFVGTDREDFAEFDDDITEDEVSEAWKEWVWGFIDGGYTEVE